MPFFTLIHPLRLKLKHLQLNLYALVIILDDLALLKAVKDDLERVVKVWVHRLVEHVSVECEEVVQVHSPVRALDEEAVLVCFQSLRLA